jgi:hypothetical protein
VLCSDKRWLKVRLFGNFVKSAQYKKHIGRLLLQLIKPKQLLTQPWLNGGQKSDFRQCGPEAETADSCEERNDSMMNVPACGSRD